MVELHLLRLVKVGLVEACVANEDSLAEVLLSQRVQCGSLIRVGLRRAN